MWFPNELSSLAEVSLYISNHNHQLSTVILIPWPLQSWKQLPAKVICTNAISSSVTDPLPYLLYWPRLDRPNKCDELHHWPITVCQLYVTCFSAPEHVTRQPLTCMCSSAKSISWTHNWMPCLSTYLPEHLSYLPLIWYAQYTGQLANKVCVAPYLSCYVRSCIFQLLKSDPSWEMCMVYTYGAVRWCVRRQMGLLWWPTVTWVWITSAMDSVICVWNTLYTGVPGGMDKTSGECSLCWTIPI